MIKSNGQKSEQNHSFDYYFCNLLLSNIKHIKESVKGNPQALKNCLGALLITLQRYVGSCQVEQRHKPNAIDFTKELNELFHIYADLLPFITMLEPHQQSTNTFHPLIMTVLLPLHHISIKSGDYQIQCAKAAFFHYPELKPASLETEIAPKIQCVIQ